MHLFFNAVSRDSSSIILILQRESLTAESPGEGQAEAEKGAQRLS